MIKRRILVGAHRGAMCHAPENTLAAFEVAIRFGTYRIELDVRPSRDGHIVLHHDATVDRMTNGTGKVSDLTLEDLRRLKVGGTETIPTLAEALDFVKGRCRLLIEIKADGIGRDAAADVRERMIRDFADAVVLLIETRGMVEACTISCFDEEVLRRVRQLNPCLATAYFVTEPKPFDPQEVITRLGVSLLIVWPRAAVAEQLAAAKRCGLHIRCGLADNMTYEESDAVFKRMAGLGVDEIASGRPDWIAKMAEAYARAG